MRIRAMRVVRFLVGVSLVLSACEAEPNARQNYVPAGRPIGQIGSDTDKPDDPWLAASPIPTRSPQVEVCSPAPCAVSGGLVVRFANLNRALTPATPSGLFALPRSTPKPGFHFVRI